MTGTVECEPNRLAELACVPAAETWPPTECVVIPVAVRECTARALERAAASSACS